MGDSSQREVVKQMLELGFPPTVSRDVPALSSGGSLGRAPINCEPGLVSVSADAQHHLFHKVRAL